MQPTAQLGLFAEVPGDRIARMDALTSADAMERHIRASIAAIDRVMAEGYALSASTSWGKDSSCVLSLALVAALERRARGGTVPPIHVVSVDTLIEQPEVVRLRESGMAHVRAFAQEHGLPIHTAIVTPRLSEQWWPRIIGGRKLPSYAGGNGDCSVDLKLRPLTRYVAAVDADLAAAGALPAVTLLGTRFDESAVRGANMRARGESAIEKRLVDGTTGKRWVLSPIAEWSTEQVFAYLQNVGQGRHYPSFAPEFKDTLRVYADSAGAGCMIDVDPSQANRGKGCGSRHGCHQCVRVSEDRSMRSMLLLDEYDYLRGLAQLRDYLAAVRWDFGRRNWISRSIDRDTGDVRLFPNNFSASECERLLRMVLTIDVRERRRADQARAQLDAGRIEDTPHNRRMAKVQFQNLTPEQIIAIDFHWSTAKLFPPFHAWRVALDVFNGHEMDVPPVAPGPRPAQMPVARYVRGDSALLRSLTGALDPEWELSGASTCGDAIVDDDAMTVDEEAAALFVSLELLRVLAEHGGLGVDSPQHAALYYLRMGIVSYPAAQRHLVDRAMRQGQYLSAMGLVGISGPDQLDARRVYEQTQPEPVIPLGELLDAA